MDHDTIDRLRRGSGAWRLLCSDNVAFALGFLTRVFVEDNVREIAESDLLNRLDDELYALNQRLGEGTYPKAAKAYLADWAQSERGWLRRYYPHGSDEPHYDATPEVELAAGWVRALMPREFVGTESRLNTIVELLRQMVHGSQTDPEERRSELIRRRDAIDAELERLDRGIVEVLAPAAQQDRYQQFAKMAHELLADLRQVEENFRRLDRRLRAQIAGWDGTKSELLDDVLGSRTSIAGSPQGQSFAAFFDFLLSPQRQGELAELLRRVGEIDELDETDPRLRYIHHDWHTAGERTQATVRMLSEQLRTFLDDQAWLENRRIMDLITQIQTRAIALKDQDTSGLESELPDPAPSIVLPTERPLFAPQRELDLDSDVAASPEVDLDDAALYDQVYVDPLALARVVRARLQTSDRVPLARIVEEEPITQGLAELVTYMSLRDDAFHTRFDEHEQDVVRLDSEDGAPRQVRLPRVTFVRKTSEAVR